MLVCATDAEGRAQLGGRNGEKEAGTEVRAGKQRTRSHSQGRLVQTWTQRTKVDTEESRALAEWPWDTRCREQGSVRCAGAGRGSGGSWLLEVSVVPRAAMRGQDMGTEKLSE